MNFDNPLFREAIGKLVRYPLFAFGTYIVSAGIWEDSDLNKYADASVLIIVGGIVTLAPLAWSWLLSRIKREKLLVAMASKPITEQQVEALVKVGDVPALNTPRTEVPRVEPMP